jgi:hypothetical protein
MRVALLNNEGEKKVGFADLDGDGLDIHTVDAVLDKFELTRVIERFFAENLLGHLSHFGWQGGKLGGLPPDVVLIELA